MRKKLQDFGEIHSICVKFHPVFKGPYSFICFKDSAQAEEALKQANLDETFPFKFKSWSKTKLQLESEREKDNNTQKFILIKNLLDTVTEEQLMQQL